MQESRKYFQESLANFTHDVASGGAIRHMVDLGYSTDAIMRKLDFPTPRARVERVVLERLMDTGILLDELPAEKGEFSEIRLGRMPEGSLAARLLPYLERNGEDSSYMLCTFGMIRRDRRARLQAMFASLTAREREYLLGIPWPPKPMYHRLISRMYEIALCMAAGSGLPLEFYFLGSREHILTGETPPDRDRAYRKRTG